MKTIVKRAAVVSLLSLMIYSCTDDYFEFDKIKTEDWRPELALPLINSSLTLADIVTTNDTNGLIQEGDSGIMQIVYDGRVFSTKGEAVVEIPTQPFEERYSSPGPLPSTGGPPISRSLGILMDFDQLGNDIEVDSMLLKAGELVLTVENTFEHDVEVVAQLLSLKDANGQFVELTFDLPAADKNSPNPGDSIRTRSVVEPLAGYTIDMTNRGTTVNEVPIQIEMTFNLVSGNSSVPTDAIAIKGAWQNLQFKEFHGYVGQRSEPLKQDSIKVNLFRNFLDAKFFLSNPLLDITVLNSYGLPVDLVFNDLFAINKEETPSTKQIQLPPNSNPLPLAYKRGHGQADTLLRLDTLDSNIDEVISFLLEELVYNATANFNPDDDKSIRNFITDTSAIGLDVFLKIPFSGYATGFSIEDTIDFEFQNSDEIDEGLVRVRVDNGFPIGGSLQIFFLDEAYDTLEVLYETNGVPMAREIIAPAPVDAKGTVTSPRFNQVDGILTKERLRNLRNSKYALVKATMQTNDATNKKIVSFRDGYRLDIAVGIKAKFLID